MTKCQIGGNFKVHFIVCSLHFMFHLVQVKPPKFVIKCRIIIPRLIKLVISPHVHPYQQISKSKQVFKESLRQHGGDPITYQDKQAPLWQVKFSNMGRSMQVRSSQRSSHLINHLIYLATAGLCKHVRPPWAYPYFLRLSMTKPTCSTQ